MMNYVVKNNGRISVVRNRFGGHRKHTRAHAALRRSENGRTYRLLDQALDIDFVLQVEDGVIVGPGKPNGTCKYTGVRITLDGVAKKGNLILGYGENGKLSFASCE